MAKVPSAADANGSRWRWEPTVTLGVRGKRETGGGGYDVAEMVPPFRSREEPGSSAEAIAWIVAVLVMLVIGAAVLWFLFGFGWIYIILLAAFLKRMPRSKR